MKKSLVLLLFMLVFGTQAQDKKFINSLKSNDPKKLEKLKYSEDYNEQLNYHLVYAVHTYDTTLLDLCLEYGADPHSPCGDCYQRDAMTVALYYQNYYAYEKIKPVYNYTGTSDEFGGNILQAAATCDSKILLDVIETYHPEFVFGEGGSPLMHCNRDSLYLFENVEILLKEYGSEHTIEILNERDSDYGTTILFDAVYYNNLEAVQKLMAIGFSPFTNPKSISEVNFSPDYVGNAFMASLVHPDHKIYDLFRKENYDFSKLSNWKLPLDPDENEYGDLEVITSIAFFLCQNTNEEFVNKIEDEFIIDYNTVETVNYDFTPMLFAIWDNNKMMVKRILDQSWDGYYYKTALKDAKDEGIDPEIYEMLKEYVSEYIK